LHGIDLTEVKKVEFY